MPPVQVDLLTLKVVSESRVTWPISMAISVFLGLFCSRLRPDVRDGQTSDAHHHLMPPTLGAGHNTPSISDTSSA